MKYPIEKDTESFATFKPGFDTSKSELNKMYDYFNNELITTIKKQLCERLENINLNELYELQLYDISLSPYILYKVERNVRKICNDKMQTEKMKTNMKSLEEIATGPFRIETYFFWSNKTNKIFACIVGDETIKDILAIDPDDYVLLYPETTH